MQPIKTPPPLGSSSIKVEGHIQYLAKISF